MNFIWSDFGVLNKCCVESDGYLYVYNSDNGYRKMSPKYLAVFDQIKNKCELLKGKFVQIRTSQNTGPWQTSVWFSDISLSGTAVNSSAPSMGSLETTYDLKQKLTSTEQQRDQAIGEALEANQRADLTAQTLANVTARKNEIEITLDMLLAGGETIACEFKESLSLDVRRIENDESYTPVKEKQIETAALKTLVGFLNAEGGTLLIGVSDSKLALGIDNELEKLYQSLDKFILHLEDLIKERLGKAALANYIDITTPKHQNGSRVVRVEVKKSLMEGVFLKPGDDFYVRFAASTERLTGADLLKYSRQHWPN